MLSQSPELLRLNFKPFFHFGFLTYQKQLDFTAIVRYSANMNETTDLDLLHSLLKRQLEERDTLIVKREVWLKSGPHRGGASTTTPGMKLHRLTKSILRTEAKIARLQ